MPALTFGPFRLLATQQTLLEGDRPVRLRSRAFDILVALAVLKGGGVGPADSAGRQPTPGTRRGLASWQVRQVRTHIESQLDKPIKAADLDTLGRLSVSYFSVAFRRGSGESLCKLLVRLRVECARTLMRSSGQPLSQIALACGFCDQAHFSRQFRCVTGSTLQRWRRERGNDLPGWYQVAERLTRRRHPPRHTGAAAACWGHGSLRTAPSQRLAHRRRAHDLLKCQRGT